MLKKLLEALLFALISLSASAWEPHGEIYLIVAYKAGTATDIGARLLAKHAEKYVGTKINVVNIPGADGKEGWFNLANATPNGQTIGYINLPTFTTFTVMRDAPFELSDIVPIVNHSLYNQLIESWLIRQYHQSINQRIYRLKSHCSRTVCAECQFRI